jgi:hypothetical protein
MSFIFVQLPFESLTIPIAAYRFSNKQSKILRGGTLPHTVRRADSAGRPLSEMEHIRPADKQHFAAAPRPERPGAARMRCILTFVY